MKILYAAPNLAKGGAEDILVNLTSHFARENDVTLFLFYRCLDDSYNVSRIDSNVKIRSLVNSCRPMHSIFLRVLNKLLYILAPIFSVYIFYRFRFYRYDIIHINMTLASFYMPFFKFLSIIHFSSKIKFVETFHTNWHLLKTFNKIIFPMSWSSVDHVIYEIGEQEVDNIKKNSFAKNISFIPFGVPKAEKPDIDFLNEFSSKHFLPKSNSTQYFMSIARLRLFEKKFDVFLEVLQKVRLLGVEDFKYIICGDGPDRKLIESMIDDMGLSSHVILTGFIDRPQQIVYLADLFLVVMVDQTTGIAGLQAGMAGVPLVGVQTSVGYHGLDDTIFSSSNIDEISEKIVSVMGDEQYKRQTTDYVHSRFCLNEFFNSYQKLYSGLLGSGVE